MKVLRGILAGIGIAFLLLILLIVACYFNPNLAGKISSLLYSKSQEADTGIVTEASTLDVLGTEAPSTYITGADDNLDGLMSRSSGDVYVIPTDTNQDVPKEVSGKSGYTPVQENREQIEEPAAEEIISQADYGETGDGLTFEESIYPYYGMLNDISKSIYRQIYANVNALNATFTPLQQITNAQLKNIFTAVCNDHPELFWLETAYGCKCAPSGRIAEVTLEFNKTGGNLEVSKVEFQNSANEITAGAADLSTDYDKEVFVHDKLISQVEYQLNAQMNQSAYSALINGKTVCAGYARAFQYLMQQLGVNCYYCTGYAGENHAWDIIELDGEFYNVDSTWDDTNPNTHDYFNCSDADFSQNHMRKDLSVNLPPCNGQAYSNLIEDAAESSAEVDTTDSNTTDGADSPVLSNMNDYYNDCYAQIMAADSSSISFQNVITDDAMWKEVYSAYSDGGYKSGYVNQVLTDKGATVCQVQVQAEELKDGHYLLNHTVSIQ